MMTGKTILILKDPQKSNCLQLLQTHNVPTNDVEKTNGTKKGEDLPFANKLQTVLQRVETKPQGNKRNID